MKNRVMVFAVIDKNKRVANPTRRCLARDYKIIPVNEFIVIHVAEHRFDLR